jgi:hypothetical protein
MAWAKVRWISMTGFEENLQGAYGGGEGVNGTKGRARLTGGRAHQGKGCYISGGVRTAGEGGVHGCRGGAHGREGGANS